MPLFCSSITDETPLNVSNILQYRSICVLRQAFLQTNLMNMAHNRSLAWVQALPLGGTVNHRLSTSSAVGTCGATRQQTGFVVDRPSRWCVQRSTIVAHAGHDHAGHDHGHEHAFEATTEDDLGPVQRAQYEWDGREMEADTLVSLVKWNSDGLVAAIAQQYDTEEVLMMAWMNEESMRETVRQGRVVYYSRSRQQLWRKGDTSGQVQYLKDMILDCDGDALLLKVDQIGVACHTGRRSCFYTAFRPEDHGKPKIIADVLMDPKKLYKQGVTS